MEQDRTLRIVEAYRAASKDTLAGGASCVLAETLGPVGSALHAGLDRVTVGIEISATHYRAAPAGHQVTGVATLLHGGRTVATYEIVISDETGRRSAPRGLPVCSPTASPGRGTAAEPSASLS